MKPAESSVLPRVLLGAAAGAAVGLSASTASAAPVFFDPTDLTISAGNMVYFDPQTGYAGATQAEGTSGLNANFRLVFEANNSAKPVYSTELGSQPSQSVRDANSNAPRFNLGAGINAGSGTFTSGSIHLHNTSTTTTYPWNLGDRGYLALGITAIAATGGPAAVGTQLYGWAEVSYNANSTLTLYSIGYDNSGGTSIAGAVPEPGSLSAAAVLGAAGLLAYRRRRRAEATATTDTLAA